MKGGRGRGGRRTEAPGADRAGDILHAERLATAVRLGLATSRRLYGSGGLFAAGLLHEDSRCAVW